MLKRPLLWLVIFGMTLVQGSCIRLSWNAVKSKTLDFAALYGAAQKHIVEREHGESSSEPPPQSHMRGPVDTLHPPFELFLFLPFAALPYLTGFVAFTAFNVVFLWSIPWVLWRSLPHLHKDFEIVALAYALSLPVTICLIQGQDSIALTFLLSCAFVSFVAGNNLLCGFLLALCMFKFQIAIPIALALAIRGGKRFVTGFSTGMLLLICATLVLVGRQRTLQYIPDVLRHEQHASLNAFGKPTLMPNLRGLVSLLAANQSMRFQSVLVVGLSLGMFIALLIWLRRNDFLSDATRFSAIVTVASLISYHYYVHNACILLLPVLLMTNEIYSHPVRRSVRMAYTTFLIALCSTWVIGLFFFDTALVLLALESLALLVLIVASSRYVAPSKAVEAAPAVATVAP